VSASPSSSLSSALPPARLEFHIIKTKFVVMLLGGVLLTMAAFYCLDVDNVRAKLAGWVGIVLFPLTIVYGLSQLLRSGPVIIFTDEGISERRLGVVIQWTEITRVWEKQMPRHRQRFLCIEVADPAAVRRRMNLFMRVVSHANAAIGYATVTLNFTALDGNIDDAIRFIMARCPQCLSNEMRPPSMRG
jgi:hypothetical protein